MTKKPQSCNGCPIYGNGEGFVSAQTGTNGVLLVFDTPLKKAETWQLNKMLTQGGLKRSDFSIHSVLSCNPPDPKFISKHYAFTAINHCAPNLAASINKTNPRCLVASGSVALHRLTGLSGSLHARGYVHTSMGRAIPTVATYDPYYILAGNANLAHAFIYDVQHAVEIAQQGFSYDQPIFTLDPSPDVACG